MARILKLLASHSAVEMQPLYDKACDFAMEFEIAATGVCHFLGLSLFSTNAVGAYQGNEQLTQAEILAKLSSYIPQGETWTRQLASIICEVSETFFHQRYAGFFGIDMMVVRRADGFALFPCIEVNLRRTMGHAMLCQLR